MIRRELSLAIIAVGVPLIVASQGCSVALTYTQKSEGRSPNISIGATRAEVERKLGGPVMAMSRDGGTQAATYEYRIPFHPTTGFWANPDMRRQVYGFVGAPTMFLSEIIFVPLEIGGKIYRSVKSEKQTITVVYGADDQVVGLE